MLLRSTLILLVLATVVTAGSPQAAGALGANGEWSGTYTLAGGKDAAAVTVAGRGATVGLGSGRGTFSLRRGQAPGVVARGLYGSDGRLAVVDDPFGPARLVDLGSGEVHALYPAGRA